MAGSLHFFEVDLVEEMYPSERFMESPEKPLTPFPPVSPLTPFPAVSRCYR